MSLTGFRTIGAVEVGVVISCSGLRGLDTLALLLSNSVAWGLCPS